MSGGNKPLPRVTARQLRRLPLFPLENVVLFPHSMIPLHIFEPRYRKMIKDVMATNKLLAISLQLEREDPARDEAPRVADVAAVGEVVMAQELSDGRYNLIVHGRARISIDSELPSDEPYRLIAAHEIPDDPPSAAPGDPQAAEADLTLRALVSGLAENIPEGGELLKQVAAAQETPAELSNVLAASLVADTKARQRLLETTNIAERMEFLTGEIVALTGRLSKPGAAN
jgi:Lon protease-like protein